MLYFAQNPKGGLRDKPGKRPDFYHTANNLAGLSLAQHKLSLDSEVVKSLRSTWKETPRATSLGERDEQVRENPRFEIFAGAMGWKEDEGRFLATGGEANRVNTTHPTLNILTLRVKDMMRWSYGQEV